MVFILYRDVCDIRDFIDDQNDFIVCYAVLEIWIRMDPHLIRFPDPASETRFRI